VRSFTDLVSFVTGRMAAECPYISHSNFLTNEFDIDDNLRNNVAIHMTECSEV
jgi:hypothetical protein